MRLYHGQHAFYAGLDLYTRMMYLCVLSPGEWKWTLERGNWKGGETGKGISPISLGNWKGGKLERGKSHFVGFHSTAIR
jgi:hypothetical protein